MFLKSKSEETASHFIDAIILKILMVFAVSNILIAPIRYILSLLSLTPLVYLPNIALIGGVFLKIASDIRRGDISRKYLILLLICPYAILLSIFYQNDLRQAIFGVYVLLPVFFGIVAAPVFFRHLDKIINITFILWIIVVSGIVVNKFYDYPWIGFTYEIGGVSVEASREWSLDESTKRLAGFSRASFDAAIQVVILATLLSVFCKRSWLIFIWFLSSLAVYYTTSRGIFNIIIIVFPAIMLRRFIPQRAFFCIPLFLGGIGFLLPVTTFFINYNFYIENPTLAAVLFSFWDRLNNMWPEAFELLSGHGNWLLGRGFGGLGAAQNYFEPGLFNAGDNISVYIMVVFGATGAVAYWLLLLSSLRLRPWFIDRDTIVYLFLLAIMAYGITSNILENASFGFVSGLVGWRLVASYGLNQSDQHQGSG